MSAKRLRRNSLLVVLAQGCDDCCAGQHVAGDVYLNLVEPLAVQDVEVRVWGVERVFWRVPLGVASSAKKIAPMREAEKDQLSARTLEHHGKRSIFEVTHSLLNDQSTKSVDPAEENRLNNDPNVAQSADKQAGRRTLPAGQHSWRFLFALPENCPTDLEILEKDLHAAVEYGAEASVKGRAIGEDAKWPTPSRAYFKVRNAPITAPPIRQRSTGSALVSHGFPSRQQNSASISVETDSGQSSFLMGEDIMIRVEVDQGALRAKRLTAQLRNTVTLKSAARHTKTMKSIVAARHLRLPKNLKSLDMTAVEETENRFHRWLLLRIPPSFDRPTSDAYGVKSSWEICVTAHLTGSGILFLKSSTAVTSIMPIEVARPLARDTTRRAAKGAKHPTAMTPIVLEVTGAPQIDNPVSASACFPPLYAEGPTSPQSASKIWSPPRSSVQSHDDHQEGQLLAMSDDEDEDEEVLLLRESMTSPPLGVVEIGEVATMIAPRHSVSLKDPNCAVPLL